MSRASEWAKRQPRRREQAERDARDLESIIYALARDMARRGLFVRDDLGAPSIQAIKELTAGVAAAIRAG